MLYAKSLKLDVENYKLETLSKHFNIENPRAHRALADAITTAKLLIEIKGK